ncbi:uncharacterized protein LOC119589890 [Penaeus monodon]|uniref:uncharacterized protein LOC119589890 n=1 Tax=Penaeus monodon TaxID=6687 RepID=UPI0018A73616|nr:uncharacterized protein LOC119589890 [Penaeus monodon]
MKQVLDTAVPRRQCRCAFRRWHAGAPSATAIPWQSSGWGQAELRQARQEGPRLLPGPGKGSRGSERKNLQAEPFPGFTGQTSQTPSSHVDQVNTKSLTAPSTSS